jgi:hypothetical protein
MTEVCQVMEIGLAEIRSSLHGWEHGAIAFAIAAGVANGEDALALAQ